MTEKEIYNAITTGCVSDEVMEIILRNFHKVKEDDHNGRIWSSVYRRGCDAKYGRIMVCLDTKEYRSTSFSEFYAGPGVFDYAGASATWCRHRNSHKLDKYIIPTESDSHRDFRQYPVSLGVVD